MGIGASQAHLRIASSASRARILCRLSIRTSLFQVERTVIDTCDRSVPVARRRFNPFSWDRRRNTPCRDLNNMNDAEVRTCVEHHRRDNESFVLQLHTQTWGRGRVLRRR